MLMMRGLASAVAAHSALALGLGCSCGPRVSSTGEGSGAGTGSATSAGTAATGESETSEGAGCGDRVPAAGEYCFTRVDLGISARYLAAGDFDGDGMSDLVVADPDYESQQTPRTVLRTVLWRAAGDVVVSAPVGSASPANVDLGTGDFDGDGRLDAVVFAPGEIWLHTGNGSGALEEAIVQEGEFAAQYWPAVPMDLGGDDRMDLMAGGSFNRAQPLEWDGAAWIASGPEYVLPGCWVNALAVGDLDDDGRDDLVAMMSVGECMGYPPADEWPVVTLLNLGGGTFAEPAEAVAGAEPDQATVADLDGDGFRDLVTWNRGSGDFSFLPGLGGGTMGPHVRFKANMGQPRAAAAGDMDGDGHQELLLVQEALYVVEDAPGLDSVTDLGVSTVLPVVVADFQSDGVDDVALVDRESGKLVLLISDP